ncbi:MAG: tRNA (adenosine(37)-N6)-threonylcarbamoyltransferase complex transferase subunit TsaD [Planctomycetota bacterium]|nr:MAG: tRNA (adenosine(37)-N6)-threonylcarbamoyltransferase complex transferase subunit TsaD [Planctomycetota bacterium]
MTQRCVLGIETSCDDTAAAVVRGGREVLSSVVASQTELHRRWGGVVPEAACRAHLASILPVVEEALERAGGLALGDLAAIAVTTRPGLVGALLVGVATARALAQSLGLPLVGVHHLEAHVVACQLASPALEPPFVCMVVSGGHTEIYRYGGLGRMEVLGRTRDDAAGEAFDKAAAMLGLPYPGGPSIAKAAERGDPKAVRFPRALLQPRASLEMSFSGLKTALLYRLKGVGSRREGFGPAADLAPQEVADLAASYQEAIVDVLVEKLRRAARHTGLRDVAVGGGVACNVRLRERLAAMAEQEGLRLHLAPPAWCTDNAAMVAALGWRNLEAGLEVGYEQAVCASGVGSRCA